VISFDVLFDSALPIKEMVRQLSSQKLSDGEIAERLSASGVQIARRTVAKYREQLKILPAKYRRKT
jgi:RNA polymerase sigma-54 factor